MVGSLFSRVLRSRYGAGPVLARNLTENNSRAPTAVELHELNSLTFVPSHRQSVLLVLGRRLEQSPRNYRSINKVLYILRYILLNGAPECLDWLVDNQHRIEALESFSFVKNGNQDVGRAIRDTAHSLITLINDPDKRAEEREAAKEARRSVRLSTGRTTTARHTLDLVHEACDIEVADNAGARHSLNVPLGVIQE